MDDRVIQAFYGAIGGLILGIAIAINWSYAIDMHTRSILIILTTTLSSAILGFLFPNSIKGLFIILWNFFRACHQLT
ncbi:hypothetical protein E0H83_09665 [Acinetobacter terrestris]|uniref:hypothetical protein n=1 Tax=Acinetobacter terrestris TaxID=2529843 RepID=UPI00103AE2FD|nr:hypothetical protein [Acinetobacter terrestris]NNH36290.1 hypothetical protein [Acinetobacter terrestris]TCB44315.1 hypothetical protein E0H83_09665 [Acinetobacter terrestris]